MKQDVTNKKIHNIKIFKNILKHLIKSFMKNKTCVVLPCFRVKHKIYDVYKIN